MRSNAKRHLRTHGIFPSAEHGSTSPSQFSVGFETPLVSEVHEAGKLPTKLRWVPPSLSSRTNADQLRPTSGAGHRHGLHAHAHQHQPSGAHHHHGAHHGGMGGGAGQDAGSDSEDEYFQPSCPLLPVPLPPVTPTWGAEDAYEERNSYEHAEGAPYISNQVSTRPFLPPPTHA